MSWRTPRYAQVVSSLLHCQLYGAATLPLAAGSASTAHLPGCQQSLDECAPHFLADIRLSWHSCKQHARRGHPKSRPPSRRGAARSHQPLGPAGHHDLQGGGVQRDEGRVQLPRLSALPGDPDSHVPRQHLRSGQRRGPHRHPRADLRGVQGLPRPLLPPQQCPLLVLWGRRPAGAPAGAGLLSGRVRCPACRLHCRHTAPVLGAPKLLRAPLPLENRLCRGTCALACLWRDACALSAGGMEAAL